LSLSLLFAINLTTSLLLISSFEFLQSIGFKPLVTDPAACFIKFDSNEFDFTICCVYVDVFRIIASTNETLLDDFENKFLAKYPVTKQTID
jgi:hypothetical protein